MTEPPSLPPWYGQVDCQTEDALIAASRAYLQAQLPREEWLRPVPPLEPYTPAHNATCDLGEYLELPDGTLQALPANHGLGHTVAYHTGPSPWDIVAVPVSRVGGGYLAVLARSPQPAPRYSYFHRGRQIRTGAPA